MLPTKSTKRMLTTMSTVIAFPGTLEPVQVAELLDRHAVTRDAVERTSPVGRRRVHRDEEARDEADDEEVREARRSRQDRVIIAPGVVVASTTSFAPAPPTKPDRQEDVDDHREQGGRAERELRVAHRVLVLRRERGTDVDPPGRPAHQPEPDERELEAAPREPRVTELVRRGWRCRSCRSGTGGSSSRTAAPSAGRRRRSRT